MEYKVKYEIEVDAKTPEEAALQVADIMRHGSYRPFLTVISPDGKITNVDLEISTVGVERTPKKDDKKIRKEIIIAFGISISIVIVFCVAAHITGWWWPWQ